ncbi:MAG: helix-turn-helix domain-containing protein [Acidimicrobiales bacterium]
MTSPTAAANATATPIHEIGRAWMLDHDTVVRGAELGMDQKFSFWLHGRAGVLGDVHADVVAAAIAFMAPDKVAELWDGNAPANLPPRRRSDEYAAAAGRWGDRVFADVAAEDLERTTTLAARVALSADPSLGVLFAGWRNITLPSTPAGAAVIALNALRELRGAAHIIAVHAVGLGPHGAIMSTEDSVRGGVAGAERFGWGHPHPVPDPEKRANSEMLTTLMASHSYDSLTEAERTEFVDLVTVLRSLF